MLISFDAGVVQLNLVYYLFSWFNCNGIISSWETENIHN
jgi:hypothetical protein